MWVLQVMDVPVIQLLLHQHADVHVCEEVCSLLCDNNLFKSYILVSLFPHIYVHNYVVESCMHVCSSLLSTLQHGLPPLYVASQEGHTEVVDSLLKSGADPNMACMVRG